MPTDRDPTAMPTEPSHTLMGPSADESGVVGPILGPLPAPTPSRPAVRGRLRKGAIVLGSGLFVVAVFTAGAGLERIGALPGRDVPTEPAEAMEFGLIREAWDLLHTEYVGARDLDSKALAYAAIDGLAEATGDTGHTRFLTPAQREEASQNLSGSFVGIGVQVDTDEEAVRIVDVFADSPAQRAGLRRGDLILEVDGTPTADTPLDEVVERVRGPEGSEVRLSIGRADEPEPLDVVVTRAKIDRPAVSWTLVPGSTIADVRLDQFQSGAGDEFKAALSEAQAAGATGAVIDLRGNPGGYVDEARAVVSQFLGEGVVYQTRDARGNVDPNDVLEGGVALELPIVVLVDAGTASSSEITAGALQDAGRAKVVGVKTFGTGTVLGEFVLTDGSALRIGTVEWLTPGGRRIWHEGITPDVVVGLPTDVFPLLPGEVTELTADELAASSDAQLLKALELLEASAAR
jgi:carboxyl-terminal processing protease